MALKQTSLFIQMSPVPVTFSGTPSAFAEEIVRRMRIVAPDSVSISMHTGDVAPNENVGIWVKGNQIWLWNEATKQYEPQDLSASETSWYWISDDTPTSSEPPIWFRTRSGRVIGVYYWNGSAWVPNASALNSGTTAQRPADPYTLEQFYDTTISALIWYERDQWRTVSGVPGDVKQVAYETLTEALTRNPGWEVLGASNTALRGRYLSQATKNPGANPTDVLAVSSGVDERAAFEVWGENETATLGGSPPVQQMPAGLALWTLVKS